MNSTLRELERLGTVCSQLRLGDSAGNSEPPLLVTLCEALGAEAGAFRQWTRAEGVVRMTEIGSVGVARSVTDAYLQHYHRYDPALRIVQDPDTQPRLLDSAEANRLRQFRHYRQDFLEPHGMHQHLGFLLRDARNERAWVFNFHRHRSHAEFDALCHARARLFCNVLQAQATIDSPTTRPSVYALLSIRERAVAEAVMKGFANKRIAAECAISVRTVENHLRAIYYKLNVHSRLELTSLLYKH